MEKIKIGFVYQKSVIILGNKHLNKLYYPLG